MSESSAGVRDGEARPRCLPACSGALSPCPCTRTPEACGSARCSPERPVSSEPGAPLGAPCGGGPGSAESGRGTALLCQPATARDRDPPVWNHSQGPHSGFSLCVRLRAPVTC